MARSSLFGRRIHLAGSIALDPTIATLDEVARARDVITALVKQLLRAGATFVIPVDAEKRRDDGQPICFDWLIWETIDQHITTRPEGAPQPLVVAVKHNKNSEQIPTRFADLWNRWRSSSLLQIENAAHWNMNSKRMELQARHGDILITLGGGEGALFLANLYHDAGKPVVPLNLKLTAPNTGSLRLFEFGLTGHNAKHLFQVEGQTPPHGWLNRIEMPSNKSTADAISDLLCLLESLAPPRAFVIRLLNPKHQDFPAVEDFFKTVVQPVLEGELGYRLIVVDGEQRFDHARIDEEIFAKLHRSRAVIADITGARPNCFIELGYALGRGLPTMLLAKEGTEHPFDIHSLSAHHWTAAGTVEDRRRAFRVHWEAIQTRPPLVPTEPLIP
jgi:hypothetical protein